MLFPFAVGALASGLTIYYSRKRNPLEAPVMNGMDVRPVLAGLGLGALVLAPILLPAAAGAMVPFGLGMLATPVVNQLMSAFEARPALMDAQRLALEAEDTHPPAETPPSNPDAPQGTPPKGAVAAALNAVLRAATSAAGVPGT